CRQLGDGLCRRQDWQYDRGNQEKSSSPGKVLDYPYLPRLRGGTSHTFRVRSRQPEARTRPSALKASLWIWPVWPSRTAKHFRVSMSQSRTASSAPVASSLLSGLRAKDQTAPLYPSSVPRCFPVSTSQTRTSPLLLSEPP